MPIGIVYPDQIDEPNCQLRDGSGSTLLAYVLETDIRSKKGQFSDASGIVGLRTTRCMWRTFFLAMRSLNFKEVTRN